MLHRSRRLGVCLLGVLLSLTLFVAWFNRAAGVGDEKASAIKGWKKGVGWGWIWGKDDELGALNAMTPETIRAALDLAKQGRTYDLGVAYSRNSYKWPGHNPCEVMSFRTPEGVKRQADNPFTAPELNPSGQGWHSSRAVHQR